MRLLIINSNTSTAVTDIVAGAARRFASPGTELVFATSSFGARVIASRTENAVAQHSTVDLAARYSKDCDGVQIAVSYDSGLRAARELLDPPVLAMTEASLLAALMLGSRVGLIIWGQGATALYHEIIDSYGLGSRICGSRRLDLPMPIDAISRAKMDDAIIAAAHDLMDQHEAEAIVLVGAVLAGRSHDLQERIPIPLLDGIRCGLPMLEAMVRIGALPPARGSYARPRGRDSKGLSSALGGLIGGDD
jgi:allantoin racemase